MSEVESLFVSSVTTGANLFHHHGRTANVNDVLGSLTSPIYVATVLVVSPVLGHGIMLDYARVC